MKKNESLEDPDENKNIEIKEDSISIQIQAVLRHLGAYKPMLEIIDYDNSLKGEGNDNFKQRTLTEVFKFLAMFVYKDKAN